MTYSVDSQPSRRPPSYVTVCPSALSVCVYVRVCVCGTSLWHWNLFCFGFALLSLVLLVLPVLLCHHTQIKRIFRCVNTL